MKHMTNTELQNTESQNNLRFLSTKEVAKALGCSLPTARKVMYRADFPLIRVGKNFKVSEQAFIDWSSRRRF